MKLCKAWLSGAMLLAIVAIGCATEAGDEVECPVCDEATEALVGTQCVPLEEVEVCGPDGHLHGAVCHCFGGQEVTVIDGINYCLQEVCGVVSDKVEADETPVDDEHNHEGEEHAHEGEEHAHEGEEHEGEEHAHEGEEHAHEGEEHAHEGEEHEGEEG